MLLFRLRPHPPVGDSPRRVFEPLFPVPLCVGVHDRLSTAQRSVRARRNAPDASLTPPEGVQRTRLCSNLLSLYAERGERAAGGGCGAAAGVGGGGVGRTDTEKAELVGAAGGIAGDTGGRRAVLFARRALSQSGGRVFARHGGAAVRRPRARDGPTLGGGVGANRRRHLPLPGPHVRRDEHQRAFTGGDGASAVRQAPAGTRRAGAATDHRLSVASHREGPSGRADGTSRAARPVGGHVGHVGVLSDRIRTAAIRHHARLLCGRGSTLRGRALAAGVSGALRDAAAAGTGAGASVPGCCVEAMMDKGLEALFDETRVDDLGRLYQLLRRIDATWKLTPRYGEYIKRRCAAITLDEEHDADMVKNLLALHERAELMERDAFRGDKKFHNAAQTAFEAAINLRQNVPAELLARHFDQLLRAGNKAYNEEQLNEFHQSPGEHVQGHGRQRRPDAGLRTTPPAPQRAGATTDPVSLPSVDASVLAVRTAAGDQAARIAAAVPGRVRPFLPLQALRPPPGVALGHEHLRTACSLSPRREDPQRVVTPGAGAVAVQRCRRAAVHRHPRAHRHLRRPGAQTHPAIAGLRQGARAAERTARTRCARHRPFRVPHRLHRPALPHPHQPDSIQGEPRGTAQHLRAGVPRPPIPDRRRHCAHYESAASSVARATYRRALRATAIPAQTGRSEAAHRIADPARVLGARRRQPERVSVRGLSCGPLDIPRKIKTGHRRDAAALLLSQRAHDAAVCAGAAGADMPVHPLERGDVPHAVHRGQDTAVHEQAGDQADPGEVVRVESGEGEHVERDGKDAVLGFECAATSGGLQEGVRAPGGGGGAAARSAIPSIGGMGKERSG
eukprot:ctg_562.g263